MSEWMSETESECERVRTQQENESEKEGGRVGGRGKSKNSNIVLSKWPNQLKAKTTKHLFNPWLGAQPAQH